MSDKRLFGYIDGGSISDTKGQIVKAESEKAHVSVRAIKRLNRMVNEALEGTVCQNFIFCSKNTN